MERLKIEAIEYKNSKLIWDLNIEKGFEIERIKEIEIKLRRLKAPKTLVNAFKKPIILEVYLYHILKHKKMLCITKSLKQIIWTKFNQKHNSSCYHISLGLNFC